MFICLSSKERLLLQQKNHLITGVVLYFVFLFKFNTMDKLSIKDLLSYLREHITLILIFVSLIGGLGQFYNLVNISAELLNFYSVSQVLIKGLFYLLLTILAFISTYFIVYILMEIEVSKYNIIVKLVQYIIVFVLQLLIFIYLIDYAYLIVIGLLLSFNLIIKIIFNDKEDKEDKTSKSEIKNTNNHYKTFGIVFGFLFLFIFGKYEIVDYRFPSKNTIKINGVACKNNNECYNLKYYNDKYAFYVLTKKDSVNGEISKVIVKKLDDVIETKNYKLYEDELSFSKAKNDSFNQVLRKQDSIFEIEMKKSRKSLDSMTKELQNSIEDYKKSLK